MDSMVMHYLDYICPPLKNGCCCTSLRKGSIIALIVSIVYGVINLLRVFLNELFLNSSVFIGNVYFINTFLFWAYAAFYLIWTLLCVKVLYSILTDTYDEIMLMMLILMTIIFCTMSLGEMAFTAAYYSLNGHLKVLILGVLYFSIQPASLIYFSMVLLKYLSGLNDNPKNINN